MKRFGTFEGVFLPTFLAILGVIMYLRLGWVIGQVGLTGALIIIGLSNLITLFTGLSIASIATNMRMGAGGAYAIISKSLGYRMGGAIGIPLYVSQAVSVAFYITGFTECWISFFPSHNFVIVSILCWMVLLTISYLSAKLAFMLQYGILAIIGFSLFSAFMGENSLAEVTLFSKGLGEYSFWQVFAVFFPAVTGILAGVSMSGELKKPEKSIPQGTLAAIILGAIFYVGVAFWFASRALPGDLAANTTIMLDLSRWRFLVAGGMVGATLSSALSMFVAAPRTLMALGKNGVIPFSSSFAKVNEKGEPSRAILLTALLSIITILLGSLNNIAVLLTMFFLITYGMLNAAVFIEKGIGIVSFRPSFKVSLVFPLLGALGCIFMMFFINPVFSILAILIIIVFYFLLIKSEVKRSWPDVRKGLFIFIAEKAIKISSNLPYHPKTWKPNLLIPIKEPSDWLKIVELIKTIIYPSGRVTLLKIMETRPDLKSAFIGQPENMPKEKKKIERRLNSLCRAMREDDILASSVLIEAKNFLEGAYIAIQTLKNSFLPPNILFIKLGSEVSKDKTLTMLIDKEKTEDLGIMMLSLHPKTGLGQQKTINLWVRDQSPNINLAVLVALQMQKNWEGRLRILQVVDSDEDVVKGQGYLKKLKKLMRIPKETEVRVLSGRFIECLPKAPIADMNIFGMAENLDITWIRAIAGKVNTSVLFLKDSKDQSAIA